MFIIREYKTTKNLNSRLLGNIIYKLEQLNTPIYIGKNDTYVNGKNLLGMLQLAIRQGETIYIKTLENYDIDIILNIFKEEEANGL